MSLWEQIGIVALVAVCLGAVGFAVALVLKDHLGGQRDQVAFVIALTVASVAGGLGLLLAVIPAGSAS